MVCGLCHQEDAQCKVHWLEKQKTWVLVLTLPLTSSVTLNVSRYLMGLIVHNCHIIWLLKPLPALRWNAFVQYRGTFLNRDV